MSVVIDPVAPDDPRFRVVRDRAGVRGADEPVVPGARCLVARRGGEAVARVAVSVADDLVGAPGRSAVLGWYEAVDREAGVAVLRAATQGMARVLGPMNGSTWGRYRLALPSDLAADPPFLSEPVNPPEYVSDFLAAGFRVVAEYESAVVEDLSAGDPRAGELAERLSQRGGVLRDLDPARFEEELEAVFRVSEAAFAENLFYAPIRFDEFRRRYTPLLPVLEAELVRLAVGADGGVLGFVLAFPDLLSAAGGRPWRVVLKTLAAAPAARGLGLGTLLTDEVRRVAHAKGYRAVVHALMQADNPSVRISRHSARVFRRYALFQWSP